MTFQQVYEQVFKATDDPQHARQEAMKFVRAKRMGVNYEPVMTVPARKVNREEVAAMIDQAVDAKLSHLVGIERGDGKRIIEQMVRDRVQQALENEIATGIVKTLIERTLKELLVKHIKSPDQQELLEKIEEDVKAAAIKAAEDLVRGLSFKPRMAETNTTRKIVK